MNTDTITAEELYWWKTTYEPRTEKKKLSPKERNKEYYLKHKEYVKNKTFFNRKKRKDDKSV